MRAVLVFGHYSRPFITESDESSLRRGRTLLSLVFLAAFFACGAGDSLRATRVDGLEDKPAPAPKLGARHPGTGNTTTRHF